MINGKKLVVVLPAYNAELTLEQTYGEIPFDIVDEVVLVDDASSDATSAKGRELGIEQIIVHDKNKGYGGNQKSCYNKALELGGTCEGKPGFRPESNDSGFYAGYFRDLDGNKLNAFCMVEG